MTENPIHHRLDALFYRVLNDVLRSIDRAAPGRGLRMDRRTRLDRNLRVDLRVRVSRRKGGAA